VVDSVMTDAINTTRKDVVFSPPWPWLLDLVRPRWPRPGAALWAVLRWSSAAGFWWGGYWRDWSMLS